MGVNGKNKGNSFERKIGNLLSARFKEYTGLETSFRRNADSGSFWGASNQARIKTHDTSKATFGDIICPENFLFSVECKFYQTSPSFHMILKREIKQWDLWIAQASQDAHNAGKHMLVIIKYNGIEEFVILNTLPENVKESFKYKDFFVLPLKLFLSLPDEYFFIPTLS